MKIEWHKPHEITTIDSENNPAFVTRRPYYYPMPVLKQDMSRYLDYPYSNELGVSISISRIHEISDYPELLLKRACWMVKNLCEKTDVAEVGVPIRLGITTNLNDLAGPYLEACNFPMSAVNWFESREQIARWSSKFDAMNQPSWGQFKRVLHIDLSFVFGTHPTHRPIPVFSRVLSTWKEQPLATSGELFKHKDAPNVVHPLKACENAWGPELAEKFGRFTYYDAVDELAYWNVANPLYMISGNMFGMSRELLDTPDFWDCLVNLLPDTKNDQLVLVAYARGKRWIQSDVVNLAQCFKWAGMDNKSLYGESKLAMTGTNTSFQSYLSQHSQPEPASGEVNRVRWHRADEVMEFDSDAYEGFYDHRPYLYPLPVLRENLISYLDYPHDSELGISLVLAKHKQEGRDGKWFHGDYPELLSKRLPWVVKHLCERTDMVETATRLRVGITTDMRDIVMPYLEACQFPMDAVNWIENRCEVEGTFGTYIFKHDAMMHPSFGEVKRVLHMDFGVLFGTHPTQRITPTFSRLKTRWDSEDFAVLGPVLRPRGHPMLGQVPTENVEERLDTWKIERLASIANMTPAEWIDFWENAPELYHVSGCIFGKSRRLLDDAKFQQDIFDLYETIHSDEAVMALYAHARRWTQSDVANMLDAFRFDYDRYEIEHYGESKVSFCWRRMPVDFFLFQHIQY